MHNRLAFKFVAGAAIVSLVASAASAQDSSRVKTRSSRRIPITKEAPGEVVSRVDTVTVYRTDTLSLPGRVDTVATTTTVTRVDTVVQTIVVPPRRVGGMYFGLAGGGALPYGAIRSVNQAGWLGQAQLGWQPLYGVLGFRGDLSLTQYAHTSDYAYLGDRPMMWNANLDAKLGLPFFNHTLGSSVLFSPYLIGGGSYIAYKNLRMKLDTDNGVGGGLPPMNAVIASGDNASCSTPDCDTSYHSRWGWNAGGGLSFHAGRKEMFVEARAVHFTNGSQFAGSWHVPVIFGVNLF